jgi:diguanylate cyclase (GGDEF)-like protein
MPKMDGIELLERVREQFPEMIRIILSGTVDMNATVRAINAGGVERLLIKPTDTATLLQALNDAVSLYDQRARERATALLDPLLEIGSRRAFDEAALRMSEHAQRYQREFSVAMIDVDHFKRYNDTYGHLAGDAVLKQVALFIRNTLRQTDELYRFGGEEFVLILPDAGFDAAATVIERCRTTVFERAVPHEHNDCGRVTICIGAAVHSPKLNDEFRTTLDRADQALYWSKRNGRNCSKVWTPDLVPGHDDRELPQS